MSNTQQAMALLRRGATGIALLAGFSALSGTALADPPVSMAPPLGTASVFQFEEIPVDRQVPLNRAVFDQGGYQLFDTAGETIVVPFTNQNLYVMQFAVSPNGTLYFVNANGVPTLYVPRNGYLENATVPGAKWYPFSQQFQPATPVFLGIAPSYTEYVGTGWYPNTVVYGGYYSSQSYISGGIFQPSFGLTFFVGGRPYPSWHAYRDFVVVHPAPYRIGYFRRPVYAFAARPYPGHVFQGYSGYSGYSGYNRYNRYNRPNGYVGQNGFYGNGTGFTNIQPNPGGTHTFIGGTQLYMGPPRNSYGNNLGSGNFNGRFGNGNGNLSSGRFPGNGSATGSFPRGRAPGGSNGARGGHRGGR